MRMQGYEGGVLACPPSWGVWVAQLPLRPLAGLGPWTGTSGALTPCILQVFHVAYVLIKFANAPRPDLWVLERSTDFGHTYQPWQFFACESPRAGPPPGWASARVRTAGCTSPKAGGGERAPSLTGGVRGPQAVSCRRPAQPHTRAH